MNIIVWACFILSDFKSSFSKCPIDSSCVVTAGLIYSAREGEVGYCFRAAPLMEKACRGALLMCTDTAQCLPFSHAGLVVVKSMHWSTFLPVHAVIDCTR